MEFSISSSPPTTLWVAGAIACLTIAIGALIAWIAFSASNLSASIDGDALELNLPIYGRSIPLSSVRADTARIVDLAVHDELRPRIRTNGIGLPGYAVGWFRLRNGDKSLAALTARNRVLHLQTTEGYALLLSLDEPERFIEQLGRQRSTQEDG